MEEKAEKKKCSKEEVLKEVTQSLKIKRMEIVARTLGHTGKIKKSHIFRIPEIRNIFRPNENVAFHGYTLKVLEDGSVPLVIIDIFVHGKMVTIDLAKLQLSQANKCFFNDLNVLPEDYFKNIENVVFNKAAFSGADIISENE